MARVLRSGRRSRCLPKAGKVRILPAVGGPVARSIEYIGDILKITLPVWTYVLLDKSDRLYIGITKRLKKRIYEHDKGLTPADRSRGPFKLIHKEYFDSYSAARNREKWLKSGQGREWIRKKHVRGI
jgi:putative endonuclease